MATILLTLDGSTFAEQAISHAVGRLGSADELLVLQVVEPTPNLRAPDSFVYSEVDVTGTEIYLERMARRLAEKSVRVRTEVRVGNAREEIIAAAARENVSLIVMASHGRKGLSRWLLGSVAESVARKAPCPVWLVRCQAQPDFHLSEPWDDIPPSVRRVLVPLDTAEPTEEALKYVKAHLNKSEVTLQLLSATNLAWIGQTEGTGETLAEIRWVLEEQAESLRREGWRVEVALDPGAPAEAILDVARGWGADLIVLASHTRTGPQRWFLGSVSERVVRHAGCPVAVIRMAPVAIPAAT